MLVAVLGLPLMRTAAPAEGLANAITHATGLQGRLLWADADANLEYLASREGVQDLVRHCKRANINTLIVDVKPLTGHVLYNSAIAPRPPVWRGREYPKEYDLLAAVTEEAHKAGLKVCAAVNVFSEGSQELRKGPAYDHPDWQAITYQADRWVEAGPGNSYPIGAVNKAPLPGRLGLAVPSAKVQVPPGAFWTVISEDGRVLRQGAGADQQPIVNDGEYLLFAEGTAGDWLKSAAASGGRLALVARPSLVPVSAAEAEHLAVFVNPINPDARAYELSILKEIASKYDVDGIVLDRMRYPNIYADFSDLSRARFEEWLGKPVEKWPEDILALDPLPDRPYRRGPLFNEWLEWRARQIRDFFSDAVRTVKSVRPDMLVGVYVGSWYADYYDVGVNWGSPNNPVPFDWATKNYGKTGYADLADFICTGAYYGVAWREEAAEAGRSEGGTVEAAGQVSNRVIADDTFTYASLYLLEFANNPDGFRKGIQACLETTQGVMLFDLVYLRQYDWWGILEQMFEKPATAPHDVPGLRSKIRELRDLIGSQAPRSGCGT